ncbi:MAG TPA: T9SS type A sorting domain-containing protein [Chitinophagales bacterium]|nr:T9SS type A sorting domain-containing protein [Chitinophagales bacterium]
MRKISTLLFLFVTVASFGQITLTPNNGCVGSTFDITITGSIPSTGATPCSAVSGVFTGATQQIAVTNPVASQASPPVTVSLTIPSNFAAGTYDFRVSYQYNGFCYSGSCVSCFTVNPKPSNVSVSPSGAISRCEGQSVNLLCSASGATSYQWTLDGGNIDAAINAGTFASTNGTYRCVATNSCGNTISDSAILTFNPLPTPATINAVGSMLHANSAVAVEFKWYLDGTVLNGQTDSMLTATQNGAYTVEITDANGCKSTSAVYNYPQTGIDNLEGSLFALTPNPASGFVTINTDLTNGFTAYIISTEGRVVNLTESQNSTALIDISKLAKGIYMVKLKTSYGEVQKRLTIQ